LTPGEYELTVSAYDSLLPTASPREVHADLAVDILVALYDSERNGEWAPDKIPVDSIPEIIIKTKIRKSSVNFSDNYISCLD